MIPVCSPGNKALTLPCHPGQVLGSRVLLTEVSAGGWCRSSDLQLPMIHWGLLCWCVTCCSATLFTVVLYWVQWNTHFLSQAKKNIVTCLVSVSAQGWAWRAYFGSTKCAGGHCLPSLLTPHDDFSSSCFIEEEELVSQHGLWGMGSQTWDFGNLTDIPQ